MNENEQKIVTDIQNSDIYKTVSTLKLKVWLYIIGAIVIGLIIYILAAGKTPSYVKDFKKANETLQISVDSLNKSNVSLQGRIQGLENEIDYFNKKILKNDEAILNNNQQLKTLNSKFSQQIKAVDGYSVKQLDSVFKSRYN